MHRVTMGTHGIFRLNERIIDSHNVHTAMLNAVIANFILATVWRMAPAYR